MVMGGNQELSDAGMAARASKADLNWKL